MDDQNHVFFVGRYMFFSRWTLYFAGECFVTLQYKMIHYCVIHSGDVHLCMGKCNQRSPQTLIPQEKNMMIPQYTQHLLKCEDLKIT